MLFLQIHKSPLSPLTSFAADMHPWWKKRSPKKSYWYLWTIQIKACCPLDSEFWVSSYIKFKISLQSGHLILSMHREDISVKRDFARVFTPLMSFANSRKLGLLTKQLACICFAGRYCCVQRIIQCWWVKLYSVSWKFRFYAKDSSLQTW